MLEDTAAECLIVAFGEYTTTPRTPAVTEYCIKKKNIILWKRDPTTGQSSIGFRELG